MLSKTFKDFIIILKNLYVEKNLKYVCINFCFDNYVCLKSFYYSVCTNKNTFKQETAASIFFV